jgi:hypothetical protein
MTQPTKLIVTDEIVAHVLLATFDSIIEGRKEPNIVDFLLAEGIAQAVLQTAFPEVKDRESVADHGQTVVVWRDLRAEQKAKRGY